ncbi:MAG: ABC-2 family transporter protein [Candidatus Sericytochromatia bacterium]|nr:ABC-2 family transporter protein [Candidatus Sericytochromatia bacterium]
MTEPLANRPTGAPWLMYGSMMRIGFLNYLAKPSTVMLILVVFVLQALIHGSLWRAVFINRAEIAGYDLHQMLTYVMLAWALRSFYNNSLDREIGERIRKGMIVSDLILPINYPLGRIALIYGRAGTRLLTTTLPYVVAMSLIFPVTAPASPAHAVLFAVTALASLAIFGGINIIVGTTAFLTEHYNGLCTLKGFLVTLVSGTFIPYALMPTGLQRVLAWLPFRGLADLPISLYLGKVDVAHGIGLVLCQWAWALILLLVGRRYWDWTSRRAQIDGG